MIQQIINNKLAHIASGTLGVTVIDTLQQIPSHTTLILQTLVGLASSLPALLSLANTIYKNKTQKKQDEQNN